MTQRVCTAHAEVEDDLDRKLGRRVQKGLGNGQAGKRVKSKLLARITFVDTPSKNTRTTVAYVGVHTNNIVKYVVEDDLGLGLRLVRP